MIPRSHDLALYWKDPRFVLEVLKALSFLAFALIVNYFAVRAAAGNASAVVDDLFFTYLPHWQGPLVAWIDLYLAYYSVLLTLVYAILNPRHLVFFLKAVSVLVLVRDAFINMTHLGIPTAHPTLSFYTQGGDLFFSGHTAMPFLAALVFWNHRPARYILLAVTIFMGAEVILSHQHYSIDVFAAPFITYGVFAACRTFFATEYSMMQKHEGTSAGQ
jgi:hypothetical protein